MLLRHITLRTNLNTDLILETIDAALIEYKHNSLVDGNNFRNILLDIRQLLTRDETADEFWQLVNETFNGEGDEK